MERQTIQNIKAVKYLNISQVQAANIKQKAHFLVGGAAIIALCRSKWARLPIPSLGICWEQTLLGNPINSGANSKPSGPISTDKLAFLTSYSKAFLGLGSIRFLPTLHHGLSEFCAAQGHRSMAGHGSLSHPSAFALTTCWRSSTLRLLSSNGVCFDHS